MSRTYYGRGGGELRDAKAVRVVLDLIGDNCGDSNEGVVIKETKDGVIKVEISWGGEYSASSVNYFDDLLSMLIPFVAGSKALVFKYECESEDDVMYIGSAEQIRQSKSLRALETCCSAQLELTPEHKKMLLGILEQEGGVKGNAAG